MNVSFSAVMADKFLSFSMYFLPQNQDAYISINS